MNDVARLRALLEAGALLHPLDGQPTIVDLAQAVAWLGGGHRDPLAPGARRLAALIGETDHLIFVLADGLGMNLVETSPETTFVRRALATELRSCFPSSSAVVLTSLATALWPAIHGVTGQWTYLPSADLVGSVLSFTARAGGRSMVSAGVAVDDAFPYPPFLRTMRRDAVALFPHALVDSVSSMYFSGRRARLAYGAISEAIDLLANRIEAAEAPTYSYLYLPHIDSEAHRYGITHPAVRAAVSEIDRELRRLHTRLGNRARIVVTADHGLCDTPPTARHAIRPSPKLFSLIRATPSGDSRVMFLHTQPGKTEETRAYVRQHVGNRFAVLTADEVAELRLLGPTPPSEHARARIGDLVAISLGVDTLEYLPTSKTTGAAAAIAHHSGLLPDEMRVPLIIA